MMSGSISMKNSIKSLPMTQSGRSKIAKRATSPADRIPPLSGRLGADGGHRKPARQALPQSRLRHRRAGTQPLGQRQACLVKRLDYCLLDKDNSLLSYIFECLQCRSNLLLKLGIRVGAKFFKLRINFEHLFRWRSFTVFKCAA